MSKIESHEDLEVWQLSMDLAQRCYELTAGLPKEERYGLVSQIRRCAVSIPSNIEEGYGRDQRGSFIQFLRIALGSTRELDTQLQLCVRLKLLEADKLMDSKTLVLRVSKMLRSLIRRLEEKGGS